LQQYIVFDFDGVLSDSFDVFLESLIKVQPKYFTKKTKAELKNISRFVGLNALDVNADVFHDFTMDLRKAYVARAEQIGLYPNVCEMLAKLKEMDTKIGIVSSNDTSLIISILKKYNLEEDFDFIIGDINLNGKDKTLSELSQKGVALEKSWYIGDTPHDIRSAKFAGMKSVAACWGYSSNEMLLKESPDFCFSEVLQILSLI